MKAILKLLAALSAFAAMGMAQAGPVTGQGTWKSTLLARDINGGALSWAQVQADPTAAAFFYDSMLDITWLANMNAQGRVMNWWEADAWAGSLDYFGGGWRLPSVIDSGAPGCNAAYLSEGYFGGTDCGYNVQTQVDGTYSEWAHLYSVTLGNLAAYDAAGNIRGTAGTDFGLVNTAYFQNMESGSYWSGTEIGDTAMGAYYFSTGDGFQGPAGRYGKGQTLLAVAVRAGDVARDVPEPRSLVLALTALVGLAISVRNCTRQYSVVCSGR